MKRTDPEDIGIQLAETVDEVALEEQDTSRESLLNEIFKSYSTQFEENQQDIQHELLTTARLDEERSRYTDEPSASTIVDTAHDYAKEALGEYTLFLWNDDYSEPRRSEFPEKDADYFSFADSIINAVVEN